MSQSSSQYEKLPGNNQNVFDDPVVSILNRYQCIPENNVGSSDHINYNYRITLTYGMYMFVHLRNSKFLVKRCK